MIILMSVWSIAGVRKLKLSGQIWPMACFCLAQWGKNNFYIFKSKWKQNNSRHTDTQEYETGTLIPVLIFIFSSFSLFLKILLRYIWLHCCVYFCYTAKWSSCTYILFFIMVHHRILNIVPCTLQQELVVYPFSM